MHSVNGISFDEEELKSLNYFHGKVQQAFKSAMIAVEHERSDAAQMVLDQEKEIIGGMDDLVSQKQRRFLSEDHTPQEMAAFTLQTDIMENLKRIYEHSKRISKLALHQEGGTGLVVVD